LVILGDSLADYNKKNYKEGNRDMFIVIILQAYFKNERECKSDDPYIKAQALAERIEHLKISFDAFKEKEEAQGNA
jgi:hypothetical protein